MSHPHVSRYQIGCAAAIISCEPDDLKHWRVERSAVGGHDLFTFAQSFGAPIPVWEHIQVKLLRNIR